MKKVYSLLLATLATIFVEAAPVITVTNNNGDWNTNSTWNLNRKPQDGDTVVIPAGYQVNITSTITMTNEFLYIKIYGTLHLDNGKIMINGSSTVYIFNSGRINSTGKSSETVRIGGVDKYRGTDGTIFGLAFANSATGSGFSASSALPVKFASFNVATKGSDVIVDWATAQELNSYKFEVERSANGSDWATIATVNAAGNSNAVLSYSYTDKNVSGKVQYYRIKQVDLDGAFIYTAVRMAQINNTKVDVKVAAASRDQISVHFSEQAKGAVVVRLVSLSGQVISQQTLSSPVGQVMVSSHVRTSGNYIVSISDASGILTSKQVIL